MRYIVNKKRILALSILMVLEVVFISLAIRCYGNKDIPVIYVGEVGEDLTIEKEDGWAGSEYVLSTSSSCLNKDGKRINSNILYNGDIDKIVLEFNKSINCFLYFSKE